MKTRTLVVAALALLLALPAFAQKTPESMTQSYDALATAILALRHAEHGFVASLLDGHMHAAKAMLKQGNHEAAAAEMALFANEGDNAIAGIRKRLLEGGHHHHADDGEEGAYEAGFVIVTKAAKTKILAAASALRQATTDEARKQAWTDFASVAKELLASE